MQVIIAIGFLCILFLVAYYFTSDQDSTQNNTTEDETEPELDILKRLKVILHD